MHIERWDPADHAVTMTCHETLQAAAAADDALGPVMSLRRMVAVMKRSPDTMEAWFVHGGTSKSALGWYWLTLPGLENIDRAYLRVAVDPDCRRQGIGAELLRHASRRASLHRRKTLVTDMAALTQLDVDPGTPEWAEQQTTSLHVIDVNTMLGYELFELSSQMYELTIESALST